tara:strand:- start:948 stop:1910 length:963 start_codon:yes stop_codon:yes gene_type:complete
MANKKISQLTNVGTVQDGDLFPLAEPAGGGSFTTKNCTPTSLAVFVLDPIAATQVSGLNKSIYFNNNDANWSTASNVVTQNPYLQVRQSDGLLVTGSGIGNAVGGDNMGNGVATTDVTMQNKNITGVHSINFYGGVNSLIEYNNTIGHMFDVKVQAAQDLALSGYRHVSISGQALDLAATPISGNVTFNNGDLTVATPGSLTVDEITLRKRSSNQVVNNSSNTAIDWSASNIQYVQATSTTTDLVFSNDIEGQTLTMYVKNNNASDKTVRFNNTLGTTVAWGGEYNLAPPSLVGSKANLYTFVRINSKIFASAVTGYDGI